ncbi:MAG: hypothetical protein JKY65_29245 [Planctomycetes bacterium]|nr:hypothetical protein [Planctomycetota bacterium]
MNRLLAPCFLLFAVCWPVEAQQAPQGPARETVWEVRLKGKLVGKEIVQEERVEGGFVLLSEGDYQVTEQPFVYRARLRCQGVGALTSYSLTSKTIQASALRTRGGVRYSVLYGIKDGQGRGGIATANHTSESRPVLVLDTLCFSHYEAVGRQAKARGHAAFEFMALTPQGQSFRLGTFKPKESSERVVDGVRRALRSGEINVGKLRATLTYDAETGRVYRVTDNQGYVAETGSWPRPYREREITIPQRGSPQGAGPIEGTYTVPGDRAGPYPTLLILPGSGPTDRNSTLGPNAPLRDLARGLAARGVASLRCDKAAFRFRRDLLSGDKARVRAARERFGSTTFDDEYKRDALPALDWLARRPETRQIILCGHSKGSVAAAEIAAVSSRVAGVILLAGRGRSFEDMMVEQTTYQLGLRKSPQAQIDAQVAQIRDVFDKVRQDALPPGQNLMGAPVRYWKDLLTRPLTPAVLSGLKQPVLIVQGGKDCQVRKADYDLLKAALEGRKAFPYEAVFFEDLNHLFMTCAGPSTGREYLIEGTLDARVPSALARWIQAQFPGK